MEPNEREGFFQDQLALACAARPPGSTLLLAGDFNCVTSQLDLHTAHPQPGQNSRLTGGDHLSTVQAEQGLTDVWRHLHPQALEYTRTTHSAHQVVTSGRTTRWLLSQELLDADWGVDCEHVYGQLPGDHAAVSLRLSPPAQPLMGKRNWVFPTYLLGDQEFLDSMTDHIQQYLAQPPNGLEPAELWADLKVCIKRFTMTYSYSKAASHRRERADL